MRSLLRWFLGYVDVRLYGHQVNRFVNLCSRNGVHLWNIKRDVEHFLRVFLRLSDFYSIKPFLRKTRTKLRVIRRHGFPFWCHRHPHLKWFPVLILLILCLYIYSRTLIWEIHITGNDNVTEHQLLEVLAEQNVTLGSKSANLDCAALEYTIRNRFSEIGWVSVYYVHTKLYIDVRESLYGQQDAYIPDGKRYDYVANKEGRVYSIVTRSGTPIVTDGAYVKAGEVLVEGYYYAYDDSGAIKQTKLVRADAQVLADVIYDFGIPITELEIMSLKISGNDTDAGLRRVGREKLLRYLEILEDNRVIILDTKVYLEKNERSIVYRGKIVAREEIGINILVEEFLQE